MANEIGLINYSAVYKAAIANDWETAKRIFEVETDDFNDYFPDYYEILLQSALAAQSSQGTVERSEEENSKKNRSEETIDRSEETNDFNFDNLENPLHIAVGTNRSHHFVEKLVDWIIMHVGDGQMLRIRTSIGNTALHYAAMVGNTQSARLLIDKDPGMAQIPNWFGHTALISAAQCGRKETFCYLLEVTEDVIGERGISPYRGQPGADLLTFTIYADFYDVALYLVHTYPNLVTERNAVFTDLSTAIQVLAAKPNAFPSGSKLGFFQRIIYSWIPVNETKALEIPSTQNRTFEAPRMMQIMRQIIESKVMHIQSKELLKIMCLTVMEKGDKKLACDVFGRAISTAVKYGISELIEECCLCYPVVVKYKVKGLNLFMAAISERQEKVFSLVYQISGHKVFSAAEQAPEGNALHIAGKLAPADRLNMATGAALQMQRELQWFKEVEKFVLPSYKGHLNSELKTPRMVFSTQHKELLQEAKQYIKDTSSSGTVVAALIVTMAFAAMFTVPGGNNSDGKPLFLNEGLFILFAIALFSSSTSVIMFLAALNSRFAEDDFLYSLPKRLTLGLISLFISIVATMVAFSATLSLVLRDKIRWIAAPVILLASAPATLFLLLQIPLLVELVLSTYGRGIFYKQRNLLLH